LIIQLIIQLIIYIFIISIILSKISNNMSDNSRNERNQNKKKGKRGKKKVKPTLPKYYLATCSRDGILQKYSRQNKKGETIYTVVGARDPRIAAMNIWKGDKQNLGGKVIYLIDENGYEYSFNSTKWSFQFTKPNGTSCWKFDTNTKSRK